MIFPENIIFLRWFQKEFLIFLKSQSWFSDTSKTIFSGFQLPKFWISFSNEFSYKFFIIFLRKFSKSEFSWQVFSFSSVHLFSRILTILSRFSFLQDFPNLYKLSRDLKTSSFEFSEKLISIFFLRNAFQLQMFSKHTSYFPTCILQNLIAHAWILCAFRIEHNFDDLTMSSTIFGPWFDYPC